MVDPVFMSKVDYVFADRDVACLCSKTDQNLAGAFFKKVWKGPFDLSNGSAALLSYSGLGQWFGVWGRAQP